MREGLEPRSAVLEGQQRALELAMRGAPVAEILDVLVRAIEAHSGDGMIASIQLVEDGRLRHGAAPRLSDEYNRLVDGLPIGPSQASCGTAAYLGEVVTVPDIATDPRWARYKHHAARYGLAASWSMPIRSPEGEVVGTFAHYYATPHDPTPRDPEAVAWIAHTAGLVIALAQQARQRREAERALAAARAELQHQVAGLHLVHELAIGLHAPTELQAVLERTLDVAIRLHGAGHGLLFLYEGDALQLAARRGFEAAPADLLAPLTEDVELHAGQRHVIEDTELDERYAHLVELSRRGGFRAAHRTPLRTRSGRLLGVLIVHLQAPRAPTDLELQLTDLCARYAADALELAGAP